MLNRAYTVRQNLHFFPAAYKLPDLRWAEEVMDIFHLAPYAHERSRPACL